MSNDKKTLYLSLKSEWYNLIESGVKMEEYREIKQYWCRRLLTPREILICTHQELKPCGFRHYDTVRFSYGYTKRTMEFEVVGISVGYGNTEWGAPSDKMVFIISLGRRIA